MASPQATRMRERAGMVLKEGYLCKKDNVIKSWKRHYFVLNHQCLCYFKRVLNSSEDTAELQPLGRVFLSDIVSIETEGVEKNKEFVFALHTKERGILLQAANNEDRDKWVEAVRGALETDKKAVRDPLKMLRKIIPGMKRITLMKDPVKGIGCTIKATQGRVLVNRIIEDGPIAHTGVLRPGDEILEIHGTMVSGMQISDVIEVIKRVPVKFLMTIRPLTSISKNRRVNTGSIHSQIKPVSPSAVVPERHTLICKKPMTAPEFDSSPTPSLEDAGYYEDEHVGDTPPSLPPRAEDAYMILYPPPQSGENKPPLPPKPAASASPPLSHTEPQPHTKDKSILSNVCDNTHMETLLQVDKAQILCKKTVKMTNEEQHIVWEDYGLRLHIPPNSLPEDCTELQLNITVSRATDYKPINEHGSVVSAVYSFCHSLGERRLQRPVNLEMQHCAHAQPDSHFFIVQSKDILPPQQFHSLQGGKFSCMNGYASVQLDHFCSLTVYLEWLFCSLVRNVKTCATLYYTDITLHRFHFHLYITPDLKAIQREIEVDLEERDSNYKYRTKSEFEFDEDKDYVYLVLPNPSKPGWIMKHINSNKMNKEKAVKMSWGTTPTPFQVEAIWTGDSQFQHLDYITCIEGAKVHIRVTSPPDCEGVNPGAMRAEGAGHTVRTGELDIDNGFAVVKTHLVKFLSKNQLKDLFRKLGLADSTLQNRFETADKDEYADDLLCAWIKKRDYVLTSTKYPGGPTWENLKKALHSIGHHGAAEAI